jgi:two-component system, NarL family, nitrate/nitrite response regulator NarL
MRFNRAKIDWRVQRGISTLVSKIELLLRSRLVKDAFSSMLIAAGFFVFHEPGQGGDADTIVIIDLEDCKDPENVRAHQQRAVKIVAFAHEADSREMSPAEIAPLNGILTSGLSADAFVQSLRLICAGERLFPRDLGLGRRPQAPPPGTELRSDVDRLSPREREVLYHVVEGQSNKGIARHLGITESTVKVHLKSLLRKINVLNRTQAAIWGATNLTELNANPASLSAQLVA